MQSTTPAAPQQSPFLEEIRAQLRVKHYRPRDEELCQDQRRRVIGPREGSRSRNEREGGGGVRGSAGRGSGCGCVEPETIGRLLCCDRFFGIEPPWLEGGGRVAAAVAPCAAERGRSRWATESHVGGDEDDFRVISAPLSPMSEALATGHAIDSRGLESRCKRHRPSSTESWMSQSSGSCARLTSFSIRPPHCGQ